MGHDGERGRRLIVGDESGTPDDLNVRAALHVGEAEVLISANPLDDATVVDVWRWSQDGLERITDGVGVHTAAAGGDTVVVRSTSLDRDGVRTAVVGGAELSSLAAPPRVRPDGRASCRERVFQDG